MAYPQKLDILSALIAEFILPPNSPLHRYKQDVLPALKQAQERRNAIVHQKWGVDDEAVVRSDVKARGVLKFTRTPVTLVELQETAAFIVIAAQTLYYAVSNGAEGTAAVAAQERNDPQAGQ